MPLISVILTSFNHAKYIKEAIDSVLAQSLTDFELIIWDDASTDNSWEIINNYTDPRIIKIRNDKTMRGIYGINKAISELSKGEFIAIHHSDDVWLPNKLEKQIDFLTRNPKYGAVFTNALAVNEDGEALNDNQHFYSDVFAQDNRSRYEWLNYFFCTGNALCHPSVLIRKQCYEDCGTYRYGFAQLGDFDMWVRLCLKYEIYVMPEKLICFRIRENEANASGNTIDKRSRQFFEYYLIIKSFLNISSFSELVLIFPDAIKYKSDDKVNIEFIWSMMLIEKASFALSKLLALELLFNIINDPRDSELVSELYDFNLMKFVGLTKKYGIANKYVADIEAEMRKYNDAIYERAEVVSERNKAVTERDKAISECNDVINNFKDSVKERDVALVELNSILNSRSWMLTAPLRFIVFQLKNLFFVFKRVIKKVLLLLFPSHLYFSKIKSKVVKRLSSSENLKHIQVMSQNRKNVLFSNEHVGGFNCSNIELPSIDITVVTHNSSKWIEMFFDSLDMLDYPKDKINLFVVDNSSTDDTLELLESRKTRSLETFADFEIFSRPNEGFGCGHHFAINKGKSSYVLVTNVDLEFEVKSLRNLMCQAVSDAPDVASWELRQKPYEHPKYVDPITLETSWSSHACILLRRNAYIDVGGYDKKIFMYGEDVELSYRFRKSGYCLKYVPSAVVHHYTYTEANEVKPVQFLGSSLANAYLRLRYGSATDKLAIPVLQIVLLYRGGGFLNSRRDILRNWIKILNNFVYFFETGNKGMFAFKGFDYGLRKDGAFYNCKKLEENHLPQVSIITRTYKGRENWLRESMASVLNQTYTNIQHVIVEDGGHSMTELVDKAKESYKGCNIKYRPLEKLGRSAVGNQGLKIADGELMMFLDDDDLIMPDHVEVLVNELVNDESIGAAYSLSWQVPTKVERMSGKWSYCEKDFYTDNIFYQPFSRKVMCHHNYIPIQSILFRKELYDDFGGFDESVEYLEDWLLWTKFALNSNFKYCEKTTSMYRTPYERVHKEVRQDELNKAYSQIKKKQQKLIALTEL